MTKHTDTSRIADLRFQVSEKMPINHSDLSCLFDRIEALEAENERLRGLVQGWHYLAVGPDEMGDYYTQKQLIKASEPYAHPALRAISGEKQ